MDELGKHIDKHGSIDVVSDFRQLTQAYTLTHNHTQSEIGNGNDLLQLMFLRERDSVCVWYVTLEVCGNICRGIQYVSLKRIFTTLFSMRAHSDKTNLYLEKWSLCVRGTRTNVALI